MKKNKASAGMIISKIVKIVVVLIFAVVGFYGVKGYIMFKNSVKEVSISELTDEIFTQEDFVSYNELPEIYINAVISVEDKRFYTHHGIDVFATGRAVLTDLKTMSFAEGGSTITQQVAKNLLFTQEKKIERKFAEVFAAFELEEKFSKKQIFELYVNTIYFGNGYYGIYEASHGYFGKEPYELTNYEAVMLAGLPNAPSDYSPGSSMKLAEKRMKVVLKRMVKCKKITEDEADEIFESKSQDLLMKLSSLDSAA